MFGESDENRSQDQSWGREACRLKEGGGKGTTVGRRTGSEAAMRAISVLANAKSNRHQKTHRVEPDGPGRKSMHLTRGGLPDESPGGVSRGRSSDEAVRKHGGAKGRRNDCKATNQPVSPAKTARTSAARVEGLYDTLSEPQASRWCSHLPRSGEGRAGETRGRQGTR